MSVVTKDTIQPSSGQALTIKDEGGTASITVATNGEATFAENVKLSASKGIDFSAQTATSATGASTTSEVLDHYEEGTWTPTVTGGVSQSGTARYTRIGNVVTCTFYVTASGTTSGNFSGLPFNTNADSGKGGVVTHNTGDSVTYSILTGNNEDTFSFRLGSTQKQLSAGNVIRGVITYFV